jgi:uncharacterized Zn-binding protein involved in type VI secretion
MGRPAAKQGDRVVGTDIHIVMVPAASGAPVPTPAPHPFLGMISGGLSADVNIMGRPAAVLGSTADNTPPHVPTAPGTAFQRPPADQATIQRGSTTVRINGKPAARAGDVALTCNDPVDLPSGTVFAMSTVLIG